MSDLGRNRARAAKLHARNFGEEADLVRAMPCLVYRGRSWWSSWGNCTAGVVAAHVTARGMGGAKGGRFDLVPLCAAHHDEAGEARTFQRAALEERYGLDLRAEADRIALGHPRLLGIRGLADRWAVWETGASALGMTTCFRLDEYERTGLLGWVRRRMEREAAEKTREDAYAVACHPDWHPAPSDREALAHAVMTDLGGRFAEVPHGENGLAWTLCEKAGWPT